MPLENVKTFTLIFQVVFNEIYGYSMSEICIESGHKRFIKEQDAKQAMNRNRSRNKNNTNYNQSQQNETKS